ncbi:MAG: signal recognition particle protein [Bacillota bacterium]|jgi:signal recognition particle subunit SRP54|nr:signal recognition particle protein [Candidatus Fermentithermobacillaceae bacterium]HOA70650.1 signal recognition particle protein [Bacillota bacterium]HOP70573.1 signal recognition particle protein [Bacillota bacterium]HPT35005.1 signal recognition particle protein [Bacillota bacterium]HPZ84997.1 signal recognition particle protein [Bacillota bacterium]
MAFENLASRLADTFKKLRGKGKLSEKDINQGLREVRLALLEADVNFRVVKQFIDNVRERCLDAEVMESLTPAQQVIKIVHQELITLLGGKTHPLDLSGPSPAVIALYGLQGSGKTTTAGKLALQLKKQGRRVLLVSCDVYRPAAQKQLELVADMAGVSFFTLSDKVPPEVIAQRGVEKAIESAHNVVILDTAGRLQIDDEMMEEARKIKEATSPRERLLVVDAMTGQEACQVAEEFDRVVDITGVILTKLDSDARGGAALSIAKVTGKPIKFASMGEKLEDFQVFHPDRMASRILGMGDVLTLIEKAEAAFDQKKVAEMEEKLRRKQFTLEDFMEQMKEVKKMGSLGDIMRMLPGFARAKIDVDVDPKELARIEAIINSMTPAERQNPDIITGSRRRRIAKGSGTSVQEVNRLLKQFFQARKMLYQMSSPDKKLGRFRLF